MSSEFCSAWPVRPLKSVCAKIGSGATPTGGQAAYQETRANFALIRSQNVFDHEFSVNGLAFISDEQAEKLKGAKVQKDDVLLNITGDGVTFARSCLVPQEVLPACVNQHVSIIRVNQEVADPAYIAGYLSLPETKAYIESFNAGGSRRAITKGHIEAFAIPLPPLSVQKEIAELLRAFNDRISILRETNAILEVIAQTLFKSWFIDFDPVRAKLEGREPEGMDEATAALFPSEFEESEFGVVPRGWLVAQLRDVAESIFSGGTPDTRRPEYWNGDIPWFSSGETRNTVVIGTEKSITKAGVEGSSTRAARRGDVLIASAGQGHTRGQTSYCGIDCYINQSVIAVRAGVKSKPAWLFFNLHRRYNEMRNLSDSHSSRGSLTTKLLAQMQLVLPSTEVLCAFEEISSSVMTALTSNSERIQNLSDLRDTLLPRLISGQIHMPQAQEKVDEALA